MRILGVFIIFAAIAMAITLGGDPLSLVDIPSMVLVIGITVGAVMVRHGFAGFQQLADIEADGEVAYTFSNAALLAGLLGSLFAIIFLLSSYDPRTIGPSMAISLLSTTYGIVLFLLSFVLCPNLKISSGSAVLLLTTVMLSAVNYAVGLSWAVTTP